MPKNKLDETLKKIAENTSKANTPISSNIKESNSLGDPDCLHCAGAGYLRRDLPLDHPNFGKLEICTCRQVNVSQQIRQRLYSLSHLDDLSDLTFETFKTHGRTGLGDMQIKSLENAYNRAFTYAGNLQGWLLIMGNFGCGETHLAAAIANFAVGMGVPTLFLTVPDLLDNIRSTYTAEDTTFEQRFEEIRNATLLVLDDFGTQNATDWAREKLFQIINYRYINHLPLVVTTNLSLDQIEPRIRSRLQDSDLVSILSIQASDYRRPNEDTGNPELSSLHLHTKKTFGTFSDRRDEGLESTEIRSLENAFKTAYAFAEKPHGWLVFIGEYSCGKTHLAAAIANYRAGSASPPLFIVWLDLLDHLRATFSHDSKVSYDRRFEEIRTTPLLVLDDLGTQSMTPWVRDRLHQIIDYRYNAELPTIITLSDTLDNLDARILSRMLDKRLCTIQSITVPSYHGAKKRTKRTKK